MKTVIHFENVSKKYRLGTSRISLLKSFSQSLGRRFQGKRHPAEDDKVLWALRDVSFKLSQGESLALIGKNGAGKSTLLKLLANITRPTEGRIASTGRLSALIELGSGFHPDLTGRENVFLNGTLLGLSRSSIKLRFDEIVAFSEIEPFIDTPIKRYSSGMLVRLGFAVASCIEPDILLVDEVLAVGDASFRQKCLKRIQALLKAGTSILFVSHNINMVEAVCSSALYIKKGRIMFSGNTAQAIETYERDLHAERAEMFDTLPRSSCNVAATDVQITKIELLDEDGIEQEQIRANQPVEIRVWYRSYCAESWCDAVIRIVRSDGLTCCMIRTATASVPLYLRQGEGAFSLKLDGLQLIGGRYFIDACISTPHDLVLLANKRSTWFFIPGAPLSHEEQSGVFEPRVQWVAGSEPPHKGAPGLHAAERRARV